jgi:hypothetical protein
MTPETFLDGHILNIEPIGAGLLKGTCSSIPGLLLFETSQAELIEQAVLVGAELLRYRAA